MTDTTDVTSNGQDTTAETDTLIEEAPHHQETIHHPHEEQTNIILAAPAPEIIKITDLNPQTAPTPNHETAPPEAETAEVTPKKDNITIDHNHEAAQHQDTTETERPGRPADQEPQQIDTTDLAPPTENARTHTQEYFQE